MNFFQSYIIVIILWNGEWSRKNLYKFGRAKSAACDEFVADQ